MISIAILIAFILFILLILLYYLFIFMETIYGFPSVMFNIRNKRDFFLHLIPLYGVYKIIKENYNKLN